MDDEFKLCWKNFQDNIASGFQNLYDRGDLVDVTLACDGKLLQAHKIVLAICSPYFQEIFTTNPCQHPIIILKDVSFNIMCELLEFMYQGVVNVKHTELQSFMKIGQLLQIKGLATNSNTSPGSSGSEKSASQLTNAAGDEPHNSSSNSSNHNVSNSNNNNTPSNNNNSSSTSKTEAEHNDSKNSTQSNSRTSTASPNGCRTSISDPGSHLFAPGKRLAPAEFSSDSLSIYSRKQFRRSLTEHSGAGCSESGDNADAASMENALNSDEFFMPPIPQISMVESRYDLGSLKREGDNHHGAVAGPGSGSASSSSTSVGSLRNPFVPAFNLDYNNFYKPGNSSSSGGASSSNNVPGLGVSGVGVGAGSNNGSNNNSNSLGINVGGPATEYPNELYMPSDYSKNFANHMDIPSNGSNMVMLSTTSLLHGNCVFNRNNTVATQQGMKTYWLCKSYRISMCRARCITHLGRIISATGVHNHLPHMRGGSAGAVGACNANNTPNSSSSGNNSGSSSTTITPNPNPGQTSYSISDGSHIITPSTSGVEANHANTASGRLGSNLFANQTPPSPALPGGHHASLGANSVHHHHHHHLTQSLPNLLVQHHTAHGSSMEQHGMVGGSGPPPPQPPPASSSSSNSVIQNIMHNPNLMHLPMQSHPHHHHQQQQQQQQHSPHAQHHLELSAGSVLLPLSPAHMQQSPQSNRSSHSMHATESPLGMKSPPPPPPQSVEADQQQHVDINASADGSAESAATTAHVIDSITISPGSGHNFKIENI
ncbi:hypothetical protein KR215_004810 [Drosophila sulfurigaster]|nr:hypothetical protein KR215_004810 [Drosophila sulfurigaster]